MHDNWNYGLKMASVIIMFMMIAASAENAATENGSKETPIASENAPENEQHVLAKRAWKQLQSGWGKRNSDDEPLRDESLEELQHRVMQLYSQQLLNNRADENDYAPEEYDAPIDKRAWKQMSNAWGKRDWGQLRGSGWGKRDNAKWNNMRGLWGKRTPGWNKLSSAWGRK